MECNKEEGIRAKSIAESKMQNMDFISARKLAIKAQKLYDDGEISKMLMVCEVHCSSEKKLQGSEINWYDILQLETTADETAIKKQYRKFALQLHPDKNQFPGAEAAFKLIGEAQRVLLDKQKRYLFDIKCKSSLIKPATSRGSNPNAGGNSNVNAQSSSTSRVVNIAPKYQQPKETVKSGPSNVPSTFWTVCPYCAVKYEYHLHVMQKNLRCPNCSKSFIAYDCGYKSNAQATEVKQPVFSQKQSNGNLSAGQCKEHISEKKVPTFEASSKKSSGKRKRKEVSESTENGNTEIDSMKRKNGVAGEDNNFQTGHNLGGNSGSFRRSTRQKQQFSYKGNLPYDEEDDMFVFVEKEVESKTSAQSGLASGMNEVAGNVERNEGAASGEIKEAVNLNGRDKMEVDDKKNSKAPNGSKVDTSSKTAADVDSYDCPDPDFHDFDKERKEGGFAVNQIWALYDETDVMPRFYALIKKVFSSKFKVRITWLEANADDRNEIEWARVGLPVGCGKFKYGCSETLEDTNMFSHSMSWEKGSTKNTIEILPKKGEIWAVFKNWNMNWISERIPDRKFEYEFVEILSEHNKDSPITVSYLGKVKGFVSVFRRTVRDGTSTFHIPASEKFRFSNKVPYFVLTGEEREGVPEGSFELDPAAFPNSMEHVDISEVCADRIGKDIPSRSSVETKPENSSIASESTNQPETAGEEHSALSSSNAEEFEIPESEFFDFGNCKSIEKFESGQIWSVNSDEDALPKYYALITKVTSHRRRINLEVNWLISPPGSNIMTRWHDKDIPICCGRFALSREKRKTYSSSDSFSHLVNAEPTNRKHEYMVLPRKGEIWALYRDWNVELEAKKLVDCIYDIGQVLEEHESGITVILLERVNGYNSVFKPQQDNASSVKFDVPSMEILRFSHRIPAFQLTKERDGRLRGCWELDPDAVPVHYFK